MSRDHLVGEDPTIPRRFTERGSYRPGITRCVGRVHTSRIDELMPWNDTQNGAQPVNARAAQCS